MEDITITQKITIELDGKSPFEYVVMKQGDKGSRILAVSLLQNKQPYEIPTDCTARIKYYKPDGNPVLNDCTLSGNEILVTYTEQMLAAAGVGKGEIVLLKGGKELKSATYYTKIVETVYKTDGFVSDKEFLSMGTIFNDMDQAAQAAAANAKIAKQAAERADEAIDNMQGYVNTYLAEHPAEIDPELLDPKKCAPADAVGQLKEDLDDLANTIISVEKSNITENIDNYKNIESTIIKSNGKLESNSYTTKFTVKKYTNLTKGSYVVKGFCQGGQCLYVLCDKNGGVIKYEDSTSQGSSGTKTVDITIDERDTILYVGGYETVTAVVKNYLDNVKLTTRLSNIYRKKVTLNGDSIAFGAGTGGTGFMDYIASKYNMTLDKKAVSGATIANLSSRYPDKHCICTSIDTMAEDANYIIFEGGYNDWLLWTQIGTLTDTMSGDLDDTKFYGALESICRQALAKWENGKIGFIITHKINDAWRTQKQEGVTYPTLDDYYQAIKDVCEKYSIPYLDLSKVSRLNTELQNYKKYTYNSDGVHPTKDGYQIFYVDTIARWMEKL